MRAGDLRTEDRDGAPTSPRDVAARRADLVRAFGEEWRPLVGFAYLMVGDRGVAEDLVQDVFVRVLDRAEPPRELGPYLRVSVANACRGWLRSPRPVVGLPERIAAVEAHPPAVELRDALESLSPRQRVAIVGRYHADLDDQSLASILGCRPATVRSLLARGLRAMRKVITDG